MTELTKHHGLGNDFLIALDPEVELSSREAKQWCDRRTGVGADGLIVGRPAAAPLTARSGEARSGAEQSSQRWTMVLWNADGSRAEVSGNGLRCLGQAIGRRLALDNPTDIMIETDAGLRTLSVHPEPADTWQVRVGMGRASGGPALGSRWASVGGRLEHQYAVDIGNPHIVGFVDADTVAGVDMAMVGPAVEAAYPGGINVHLVHVVDRRHINLAVWERGVGVTQACGSGACAAAWAANHLGLTDPKITVTMPGGSATVELNGGDVFLTGPATYVGSVLLG